MALCSDACAVIRMTGVSGSCARTADRISIPVTPGIFTSVSTMSGAEFLSCSSPAFPPWAMVTSKPSFLSRILKVSRIPCSSSITRIDGSGDAGISGSLLLTTGGGEIHGERRAVTGLAVHQHEAAMRLDGALDDGEAEPRATDSSRREWLEQALLQLLGDAGTVIAHLERHRILDSRPTGQLVRGGRAGPDGDGGALPCGLHGVQHEVRDHPVQQVFVSLHGRGPALKDDARIGPALGVLTHQPNRRFGHGVEIHGAAFGHAYPREVEEL